MVRTALRRRAHMLGAAAALGVGGLVLWSGTALAAGTGYGPGSSTGATPPGGFSSVVTSQTVSATGGTVSASYSGETVAVSVPSGDFPGPVQVTVTAPSTTALPGVVTAFDLSFAVNGQAVTGALAKPVTFTIKDSSISAGDTVDVWNGSAWVAYASAVVQNGEVVITVTSDPAFAVLAASTTSTPPATVTGATTATTGIPVDTLAGAAAGFVALGGLGLLFVRRRKPTTTRA